MKIVPDIMAKNRQEEKILKNFYEEFLIIKNNMEHFEQTEKRFNKFVKEFDLNSIIKAMQSVWIL